MSLSQKTWPYWVKEKGLRFPAPMTLHQLSCWLGTRVQQSYSPEFSTPSCLKKERPIAGGSNRSNPWHMVTSQLAKLLLAVG